MKKLLTLILFSVICFGAGARSITLIFDDGTKVYYHPYHISSRFQIQFLSNENGETLYRLHDPVDWWRYHWFVGGWGWVSDYQKLKKKIEQAGKGDKIRSFTVEYLGKKEIDILVKKVVDYRFLAEEQITSDEQ
ncbi:hypothetical protein [Candidatus Azobacteroides pseudotrichonymphae]|uniref:Uncharacterized protein n=1 Tax=Azobacteroides pseudotrichonymphae genomovar. CFP2 TaxID=511995 RepID=B6YS51_AZOPC|nr:hypothetical protein [Candidatus Azobacteroides pseudotrichonymphae]BAG84023.1 hypothetical protein CFPG_P1-2 [Candidatus Azobacteroides pseudotrichonymphae genomovar. CFP2]